MSKVSKIHYRPHTDFNALNAMYVKDVEDGVCSFYATLYTEYCCSFTHVEGVKGVKDYVLYSVYRASHPSKGEGYLLLKKPSILWV